eukprot:scaffold670221_cov46-Prasinocladus_malaysianus.AAC.1
MKLAFMASAKPGCPRASNQLNTSCVPHAGTGTVSKRATTVPAASLKTPCSILSYCQTSTSVDR